LDEGVVDVERESMARPAWRRREDMSYTSRRSPLVNLAALRIANRKKGGEKRI